MYGRQKKMQRTNFTKNFLSLCIMCVLVFLVSSCAGRAYYEEHKPIVSNFLEDENRTTVILRISAKRIDASTVPGSADVSTYALDTAIKCALFGVFGLLDSVSKAPTWEKGDHEFQENISEVIINTIRAEDDYFIDHFLKKLSFPPHIRPDFKVSSKEQLKREEQEGVIEPADPYLIVDLFLSFRGREKGWSGKVWLSTIAILWFVKDEEAFHRFLNGDYKLKHQTPFCDIEDIPNGRPKIVAVFGFTVLTNDFKKKKWLADNGHFFDKQFKFVLARLASEINQWVLEVDQPS